MKKYKNKFGDQRKKSYVVVMFGEWEPAEESGNMGRPYIYPSEVTPDL